MEDLFETYYDAHIKTHQRHLLISWLESAKAEKIKQLSEMSVPKKKYHVPTDIPEPAVIPSVSAKENIALNKSFENIHVGAEIPDAVSLNGYDKIDNSELKDTFEVRSCQWNYDLALKETLENIFERDQYNRLLWSQAVKNHPGDTERNERLARKALMTDSLNLVLVDKILSQHGFPRKDQVGDFGNQAVWLVFQHADLDYQKRFLPQMEAAVSRGDIAPLYLALLRDRIDVREGRPQRYGTQIDGKGNLAPLLDASRVNKWRQEVGLPPIEQFENRNK